MATTEDPAQKQKSPQGEGGAIERQVRRDIDALITEHPMGESLAQLAFRLSASLDGGAGQMEAALSRELRATLDALAGMGVSGDSDLDTALSTPVGPVVSTEVRNTPESLAPNAWTGGRHLGRDAWQAAYGVAEVRGGCAARD